MQYFHIKSFIFCLLILFLSKESPAQINIHKHITVDDGLVQGQISSMIQDSKGYIWFGTYDGVSKWDGNNFFNIQTHNGLPSAQVTDIKEGIDGKIYIATFRGGILVYDNGKLDTLDESNGIVSNALTHISILKNGDILFCGIKGSITKLRNGNLIDWGKEIKFPNAPGNVVWDTYEAFDNSIYFATQDGLLKYSNNSYTKFTTSDGLLSNHLRSVQGDSNGNIFIGTYLGINKLTKGEISEVTVNGKKFNSFVIRIIISSDNIMYFATTNGLVVKNDSDAKLLTELNGLSFKECWSILEDQNKTIYIGSNGKGASIYNPSEKIINFNSSTGLPNESIWAIHQDKNNILYFGSVDGLLIRNDNLWKTIKKRNGLTGNFIREIFEDRKNRIYLATNSGLNILEGNKVKNFTVKDGLLANQIHAIAEDQTGDIYLGTQNGVSILTNDIHNNKKSETITDQIRNGLNVTNIQTITFTQNNEIVYGTFNGIAMQNEDKFHYLTTANGLVNNVVNTTFADTEGRIYAGTFKGINIIENLKVVDTIDVNDGLSNNAISGIEEGENGDLYVSTFNGFNILKRNGDKFSIRKLYKKDGLVGNDFTQEGSFIDREGNIWLGTLYGVSKYNPNADLPNNIPPNIYMSELEIFNKPFPINNYEEKLELKYDQNYLKFSYTGINLSSPQEIVYNYKLQGVDTNWVISKENNIQYTGLEPGNYIFEVKAKNEWDYWSDPIKLTFAINPAIWQTWWVKFIVVSLIVGTMWLAFRYRLLNLLRIERLRTRIASNLHDEVGSLLTQIAINADSLLYTNDQSKVKEKSGFIRQKSEEVIGMMSDVIWSIDSRNDNMESLVDRIHNFAISFIEQRNIKLNYNSEVIDLQKKIKIEFRQNVMMIVKEAINNAVKYSGSSEIELKLKYSNNKFEIIIRDNGKGVDLENIKYGNGLKNMKMRADLIKAEIYYKNDNGFTIYLIKNKL